MFALKSAENRQKGFSLIEMLTVIAVMAAMIGLSSLAISSLTSTGLSTATRQVADFMNLCRSRAISERTVVRFGVGVSELKDYPDVAYRAYSSWSWDKIERRYVQSSKWYQLSADMIFETGANQMIRQSPYAVADASSIRGDHFVEFESDNPFMVDSPYGQVEVRFFEYTAAGRARVPNGEQRNIISILKPGNQGDDSSQNWSQINVDRLTGRVRVYRP